MALALLCPSHPAGFLLCAKPCSGCSQWVSLYPDINVNNKPRRNFNIYWVFLCPFTK